MKKSFELRLKNGSSILASTNDKGVCLFSLNGQEISIHSEGTAEGMFTCSIEKNRPLEEREGCLPADDYDVISLQEVSFRKNARASLSKKGSNTASDMNLKVEKGFLR